jgi:hypothetical protein
MATDLVFAIGRAPGWRPDPDPVLPFPALPDTVQEVVLRDEPPAFSRRGRPLDPGPRGTSAIDTIETAFRTAFADAVGQPVQLAAEFGHQRAQTPRPGWIAGVHAHGCQVVVAAPGDSTWSTFVAWIDLWLGHARFADAPTAARVRAAKTAVFAG